MKMGCGIVSNVRNNRRSERRRKFGYVRGKRFKTENIVDYTSAEEDGFLEGTEAYSSIERMKSILRFVSALMRNCLLSSVKILIMHQYYLRLFTR
jgi:hypothetical protein